MKTLTFLFLAGAVVAAPGAAIASSQAALIEQKASATNQATDSTNKDDKKVCRKLKKSGTRMSEKVCLTKQEWARIDRDA